MVLDKMTLTKKIRFGFGFILLLLVVVGLWSVLNINKIINYAQETAEIQNQIVVLYQIKGEHLEWENHINSALIKNKQEHLSADLDNIKNSFTEWYYNEERLKIEELVPSVKEFLHDIENYHKVIIETGIEIEAAINEGTIDAMQRANTVFDIKTIPNLDGFIDILDLTINTYEAKTAEHNKNILDSQFKTRNYVVIVSLLALLLGIVIVVFLIRNVRNFINDSVKVLNSSISEISVSTHQLSSSQSETSVSVNQTTTTMEELQQAINESNQKANYISKITQNAEQISENGQNSVNETINGMNKIRSQMEGIAESVVKLSEQSQTIGEIINTVADLAEQSNLLAVNASIEAAKAGEYGKGFTVVAQEIKSLAEQSKRATVQIRSSLNDIQKATGSAVMATEQGNKIVESVVEQSAEASVAINEMTESISEVSQAVIHVVASRQQQYIGIEQVTLAMENIQDVSYQNVDSAKQLEKSAQNLKELWERLILLIEE